MSFLSHRRARNGLVFALLAVVSYFVVPAKAASILSNLDGNDGEVTSLVVFGSPPTYRAKALGFTMPAGSAYSLDDVVMRLATNGDGTMGAELFASSGGLPTGSPLDTFKVPALSASGNIANYTLTPTSPFVLQPSTTYFFAAYGISVGTDNSIINWYGDSAALSNSTTDPANVTNASTGIIPTGVATWDGFYTTTGNVGGLTSPPSTTESSQISSFQVDGTLVASTPLPSSLCGGLSLLGVLGLATAVRRRFAVRA